MKAMSFVIPIGPVELFQKSMSICHYNNVRDHVATFKQINRETLLYILFFLVSFCFFTLFLVRGKNKIY